MSSKLQAEKKANSKHMSTGKSDVPMKSATGKSATINPDTSTPNDSKTQDKCIAEGCQNLAVADSEWDCEYCSISCCYDHCKFTFNAWLESNKKTKAKTSTISSTHENVASTSNQHSGPVNP
ncbi:uncharacterized protein LOC112681900 isoform X2 [Sipha flava]|uniref:Uncharacterized protein LOC112681900 isoform X2 n=1 Tax=Sipha flava TaxID=143950 RepID=A0A8B8FBP7_9HEMI|nr:uncharacterized protein LOC112681900 isoform X2 [Sipha flava]